MAASRLWGKDDREGFELPPAVDSYIIVNASAPPRVARLSTVWPMRNVQSFRRIISVLYANTLTPRLDMFGGTEMKDRVLVLDIAQPPLQLARALMTSLDDEASRSRAAVMVRELENTDIDRYWQDIADEAAQLPTRLGAIGSGTAIRLLRHGFVSATVACHARLGSAGLDKVPGEGWFTDLVERDGSESTS